MQEVSGGLPRLPPTPRLPEEELLQYRHSYWTEQRQIAQRALYRAEREERVAGMQLIVAAGGVELIFYDPFNEQEAPNGGTI
jgi:hypothetical protein